MKRTENKYVRRAQEISVDEAVNDNVPCFRRDASHHLSPFHHLTHPLGDDGHPHRNFVDAGR